MRMTTQLTSAWLSLTTLAGCDESRMELQPAHIEATLSEADRQTLSPEVRRLYEAMVDGTLIGAQASNYQGALDQADEVRGSNARDSGKLTYVWYALTEDRSAEYEQRGEYYEGPPMMWVRVQKKYGHVYECGIAHPCY